MGVPLPLPCKTLKLVPEGAGDNIAWAIAPNYSYSGYCSPLSRGFPAQQGQMETHQETADTNSEQASPFLLLSFAKTTISAVEIQGGNFLFA